ncbi:hypothetical protein V8G54_014670 [Vigna mungo]|uniref:Retrotransposon gag domain-containing protein n=1 Tax=Vigna mungo TaxID=3915 RepID=A0AAQ3NH29_VIGMU
MELLLASRVVEKSLKSLIDDLESFVCVVEEFKDLSKLVVEDFDKTILGADFEKNEEKNTEKRSTSRTTANLDHSHWVRQDHYVYLALLGSCGSEAEVVMSSATSSADAWTRLMKAYANRSRTRIMSLKERLASITKGSSSISEYLQSIRFLTDELALIGHLVDDLDLVIATLNGLGPSFREFNAFIRFRYSPLSFDELFDKLVDFDTFIQCDDRHHQDAPLTANHVNKFSSYANRGKRHPRDYFPPTKSAPPPSFRPSSPPHPFCSSSHMVPTCQYCDRRGHTAKTCYRLHSYPTSQYCGRQSFLGCYEALPSAPLILICIHIVLFLWDRGARWVTKLQVVMRMGNTI